MQEVPSFRYTLDVPWTDTDAAQVVWFGNFVRYVEAAEVAFFASLGMPLTAVHARHAIWMPRTHLTSSFRSPARFADRLVVSLRVTTVSERRVGFAYTITQEGSGQLVSEGAYRIACVDAATFLPRIFPLEVLEGLAKTRPSPSTRE